MWLEQRKPSGVCSDAVGKVRGGAKADCRELVSECSELGFYSGRNRKSF